LLEAGGIAYAEREQKEASMRDMLAPLSPHEEAALRQIGFGNDDPIEPTLVRRLLLLDLIAWNDGRWTLTELGQRRYGSLVCIYKESVKVA
jgi:hypothetical protein